MFPKFRQNLGSSAIYRVDLIWPGIIYLYTTLTDGQNLPFVHLCGVIIATNFN